MVHWSFVCYRRWLESEMMFASIFHCRSDFGCLRRVMILSNAKNKPQKSCCFVLCAVMINHMCGWQRSAEEVDDASWTLLKKINKIIDSSIIAKSLASFINFVRCSLAFMLPTSFVPRVTLHHNSCSHSVRWILRPSNGIYRPTAKSFLFLMHFVILLWLCFSREFRVHDRLLLLMFLFGTLKPSLTDCFREMSCRPRLNSPAHVTQVWRFRLELLPGQLDTEWKRDQNDIIRSFRRNIWWILRSNDLKNCIQFSVISRIIIIHVSRKEKITRNNQEKRRKRFTGCWTLKVEK